MEFDNLKKDQGLLHLGVISSNFQNYEIPTNVTNKNTKFTTKSVHIVTCGSFEILIYMKYEISICEIHIFIGMHTLCLMYQKCSALTLFYDSVSRK